LERRAHHTLEYATSLLSNKAIRKPLQDKEYRYEEYKEKEVGSVIVHYGFF